MLPLLGPKIKNNYTKFMPKTAKLQLNPIKTVGAIKLLVRIVYRQKHMDAQQIWLVSHTICPHCYT